MLSAAASRLELPQQQQQPQQMASASASAPARAKKRSGPKSKTSPYLGVTQYRKSGRWEAHIWIADPRGGKGGQKHLGSYHTAEEAAKCYDRAAIKTRGAAAELNFPYESYNTDPFLKDHGRLGREPFIKLMRETFAIKSTLNVGPPRRQPAAPRRQPRPPPKAAATAGARAGTLPPPPLPLARTCISSPSASDASTQPDSPRLGCAPGSFGLQHLRQLVVKEEPADQGPHSGIGPGPGHLGADAATDGGDELELGPEHLETEEMLLVQNPLAQHTLGEEAGLWGATHSPLSLSPLQSPIQPHQGTQQLLHHQAERPPRVGRSATSPLPAFSGLGQLEAEAAGDALQPPATKVRRVATMDPGSMAGGAAHLALGGGFLGLGPSLTTFPLFLHQPMTQSGQPAPQQYPLLQFCPTPQPVAWTHATPQRSQGSGAGTAGLGSSAGLMGF